MSIRDSEKKLDRYRHEDQERAAEQYLDAARLFARGVELRKVIHTLYGVSDDPPEVAHLFGNPAQTLLSAKTAVVIQPVSDPGQVIPGLDFEEVVSLIHEGHLVPLIKDPLYYVKHDHLAKLILRFRPPSYFWRSDLLYSLLSGATERPRQIRGGFFSGEAGEWFNEAYGLTPIIRSSDNAFRQYWEPEQASRLPKVLNKEMHDEIVQSFAFKVVNAKALLGSKFVDTIIRDLRTEELLRFLTTFHILTDHPMSHALLTTAAVDCSDPSFKTFQRISRDYITDERLQTEVVSIPLRLFAKPTFDVIRSAKESGVRILPCGIEAEIGSVTKDDMSELQNRCTEAAAHYDYWLRRYKGRLSRVERVFKVCLYGVVSIAAGTGQVSVEKIASLVLSGIGAIGIAKTVADSRSRLKLQHLVIKVFDPSQT